MLRPVNDHHVVNLSDAVVSCERNTAKATKFRKNSESSSFRRKKKKEEKQKMVCSTVYLMLPELVSIIMAPG